MRRVVFWIRHQGNAWEDVEVLVNDELKTKTNGDGFCEFTFPVQWEAFDLELRTATQSIKVKNFQTGKDMTIEWDFNLVKSAVTGAPELHISGENFFNSENELFRVQGATFFTDFLKYLQNNRNEANNDGLRELGVNTKRVFGCTYHVGDLNPYAWPDYYDRLDRYFELQKKEGFNILFPAIARDGDLPPDLEKCQEFIHKTSEVAGRWKHVLFSIGNEPWKNLPHDVSPQDLVDAIHPSVNMYELGSFYEPKRLYEPPGTFGTEHTPRDSEWERKYRHIQESREHYHIPTISAEPMGAANFDTGDRKSNPRLFLEYFAGCAMYGGGVFHSQRGLTADFPDGAELECFKACARAWKYVDRKFLDGQFKYFFSDFSQGVPALKFYGVELGNEGIAVLTRPTGNPLVPVSGWRVVEVVENCVVHLEKV